MRSNRSSWRELGVCSTVVEVVEVVGVVVAWCSQCQSKSH